MTIHPSSMSSVELLRTHRLLHTDQGDSDNAPSWAVAQEKSLCLEMNKRGFPPRYCDSLAKAANTQPTEAPPPSVEELLMYAHDAVIGVDREAVSLVKSIRSNQLYLGIASPALRPAAMSILKAVQRILPPGVHIALDEQLGQDELIEARAFYALQLIPLSQREPIITTVKAFVSNLKDAAVAASRVFKAGLIPSVPFRVLKQEAIAQQTQHIVTGVVLEPEVPDASKGPDGSDGDIYNGEEIYKAMVWWMENARHPFAYNHVDHGGKLLSPEDVVILENWQTRASFTEGDQVIRKGTWMLTTRVKNAELWQAIEEHKINSWSLGLSAMGALERIAA